jgi:hypothetical protein
MPLASVVDNSCVGIAEWSLTRERLVIYMAHGHY